MINSPSLDEFAKTNLFENVVTENRDLSVQSDFVSAGADDELYSSLAARFHVVSLRAPSRAGR